MIVISSVRVKGKEGGDSIHISEHRFVNLIILVGCLVIGTMLMEIQFKI